jgi:hypothetical protein
VKRAQHESIVHVVDRIASRPISSTHYVAATVVTVLLVMLTKSIYLRWPTFTLTLLAGTAAFLGAAAVAFQTVSTRLLGLVVPLQREAARSQAELTVLRRKVGDAEAERDRWKSAVESAAGGPVGGTPTDLMFGDTDAAPRTVGILRATVHALLQVPGSTLLDAHRLLDRKDSSFRRSVADMLQDEHARQFWREVYPAYPKDAHLPIVTRFARLIGPRAIRTMLCAPGTSFDIGGLMNGGGVMLCALSDGRLGPGTARLLGQLVITRVQLAAMRRVELAPSQRRLTSLIVDEFAEYVSASASFERLLSRARKYGLALVIAHQQTAQLPERLLKVILGNTGTIVSFRVGASDARILARELTVNDDKLSATAFASLGVGDAIVRADRTTFRMRTIRPYSRGDADIWVRVRDRSRGRVVPRAGVVRRQRPAEANALDGSDPTDPFGGKS